MLVGVVTGRYYSHPQQLGPQPAGSRGSPTPLPFCVCLDGKHLKCLPHRYYSRNPPYLRLICSVLNPTKSPYSTVLKCSRVMGLHGNREQIRRELGQVPCRTWVVSIGARFRCVNPTTPAGARPAPTRPMFLVPHAASRAALGRTHTVSLVVVATSLARSTRHRQVQKGAFEHASLDFLDFLDLFAPHAFRLHSLAFLLQVEMGFAAAPISSRGPDTSTARTDLNDSYVPRPPPPPPPTQHTEGKHATG